MNKRPKDGSSRKQTIEVTPAECLAGVPESPTKCATALAISRTLGFIVEVDDDEVFVKQLAPGEAPRPVPRMRKVGKILHEDRCHIREQEALRPPKIFAFTLHLLDERHEHGE